MPEKLTSRQAAEYIGVTPSTLDVWRCKRVSHQPPYHKRGRKVIYLKPDLDKYIEGNRHER
jgi:Helix-turn-helix domain